MAWLRTISISQASATEPLYEAAMFSYSNSIPISFFNQQQMNRTFQLAAVCCCASQALTLNSTTRSMGGVRALALAFLVASSVCAAVEVTYFVKHQPHLRAELLSRFDAVSDPTSPSYGQHLSFHEVVRLQR